MEPLATSIFLTAAGFLLLAGALMSPMSRKLGVPMLLVFLLVGMLAGEDGIGGIPFDNYETAFRLGSLALVLILFDGALNTKVSTLRSVAAPALVLATLGVVLTAAITAGAGLLLGLSLPVAVLVGCVVSSTDAAAVFNVLRGGGIRLRGKTGALLEVESGINDPMAMMLTVVGTEYFVGGPQAGEGTLIFLARQLVVGAIGGLAIGWLGRFVLHRAHLPAAGLYPVLSVAIALIAFGLPSLFEGSGLLSVYLAGLVIGSGGMPYRAGTLRVHDALAWLAQLVMFLMLGLLVMPQHLVSFADEGFAVAIVLVFVARPIAVLLLLAPFRMELKERLFTAWVGMRGAVPIILATYPVLRGVPSGDEIFHVVFFIVLLNGLVPGATLAWLARRWQLTAPAITAPPASVELVSLSDYAGEFHWYYVAPPSAVCGAHVRDLPLPTNCVLTLILRGHEVLAPRGMTCLQPDDHVCVFSTKEHSAFLNLLFGASDESD